MLVLSGNTVGMEREVVEEVVSQDGSALFYLR